MRRQFRIQAFLRDRIERPWRHRALGDMGQERLRLVDALRRVNREQSAFPGLREQGDRFLGGPVLGDGRGTILMALKAGFLLHDHCRFGHSASESSASFGSSFFGGGAGLGGTGAGGISGGGTTPTLDSTAAILLRRSSWLRWRVTSNWSRRTLFAASASCFWATCPTSPVKVLTATRISREESATATVVAAPPVATVAAVPVAAVWTEVAVWVRVCVVVTLVAPEGPT